MVSAVAKIIIVVRKLVSLVPHGSIPQTEREAKMNYFCRLFLQRGSVWLLLGVGVYVFSAEDLTHQQLPAATKPRILTNSKPKKFNVCTEAGLLCTIKMEPL